MRCNCPVPARQDFRTCVEDLARQSGGRSALLARFPTRRPGHLTVRAGRLRARLLVPPAHERPGKPRTGGITEIRGPYYDTFGRRHLEDVIETVGAYVDTLKFAGGSFALMPRRTVADLIELCHSHDVRAEGDPLNFFRRHDEYDGD